MVDDGRRDMKGDGDGWYLRCAREGEGPQGVSFYSVSSLGSLHLVESVFICSILSMGCIL